MGEAADTAAATGEAEESPLDSSPAHDGSECQEWSQTAEWPCGPVWRSEAVLCLFGALQDSPPHPGRSLLYFGRPRTRHNRRCICLFCLDYFRCLDRHLKDGMRRSYGGRSVHR